MLILVMAKRKCKKCKKKFKYKGARKPLHCKKCMPDKPMRIEEIEKILDKLINGG